MLYITFKQSIKLIINVFHFSDFILCKIYMTVLILGVLCYLNASIDEMTIYVSNLSFIMIVLYFRQIRQYK
jgi:hypothetical protein